MKKGIHPETHPVVFVDGEHEIVSTSTLTSSEKRKIDGVEHYVVHVDISSYTHPFYTGKQRIIDTAGQVERFMRRLEVGTQQRDQQKAQREAEREAELEAKRKRRGLTPRSTKASGAAKDKKAAASSAEGDAAAGGTPDDTADEGSAQS